MSMFDKIMEHDASIKRLKDQMEFLMGEMGLNPGDPLIGEVVLRTPKKVVPRPATANLRWSDEDSQTLVTLTMKGISDVEIAKVLGRTRSAVYSQRWKLAKRATSVE